MRFQYSVTDATQTEYDSLPRLPLTLHYDRQRIERMGLVDSGATVNVLPYSVGEQLGARWEDRQATIRLAGSLGGFAAQPLTVMTAIADFPLTRLVFAWSRSDQVPLILGQMNFFIEFEVCFFRAQFEFTVKPRSA